MSWMQLLIVFTVVGGFGSAAEFVRRGRRAIVGRRRCPSPDCGRALARNARYCRQCGTAAA